MARRVDGNEYLNGTLGVDIDVASMGASQLGVKAGTSSNDAAVGGVLSVTTATGANVGTGEDDLTSYTVPANTLATNGQSIRFEAAGTLGANTNTKTIRVYFAGGSIFDSGNIGGLSDPYWYVQGRIVRTGATSQVTACFGGSKGALLKTVVTGASGTLSGTCVLKVTGEAVSNNDIVLTMFVVSYDDQNS